MDPLTVVSLVANIVQLVNAATDAATMVCYLKWQYRMKEPYDIYIIVIALDGGTDT